MLWAASREFRFSSKPAHFCSLSRSLRRLHFESCPEFLAATHKKLVGCSSLLRFKAELLVLFPGRPVLPTPWPRPSSGRVSGSRAPPSPAHPRKGCCCVVCQTENTPMLGDTQARTMHILYLCAHGNTNTCLLRVCLC